jgi:hypothetical protein
MMSMCELGITSNSEEHDAGLWSGSVVSVCSREKALSW